MDDKTSLVKSSMLDRIIGSRVWKLLLLAGLILFSMLVAYNGSSLARSILAPTLIGAGVLELAVYFRTKRR